MKIVTKLSIVATLATFMFAGVNLTWGNAYTNSAGDALTASPSFGVWLDVNDTMAFGWENGLKVGFDGPAGMQMRMGYTPNADANLGATTVGMSRAWWTSTGDGWGTSLSTAVDWGVAGTGSGDFTLTMNLGFGF
tara:strand:- start:41 stop:445 length:405 start_codon:yes stop_codon:yes gene_type:complete